MNEPTLQDYLPLWAFFLTTLGISLLASEIGYRLGRYRRAKSTSEKAEAVGSVVGATVGLLAFLLAFTFGMAASRYQTRREAFQQEVNAIGTTYLRAAFLPEPHQTKVRALLRDYVDVRLEAGKGTLSLAEAIRRSEKLHNDLWKHTVETGRDLRQPGAPNAELVALFVESLNQTIDMHSNRVAAVIRSRVPQEIWIGLFVLVVLAKFSMGYDVGLRDTPRPMVGLGMIFCFAVTMWLIADLDRPQEGFIRVNQQAMFDLRASMNDEAP